MKLWLLDTGPIVAYLDSRDDEHENVVEHLNAFKGRLVTTSAVIVEAMHFASRSTNGPAQLLDFLLLARAEIYENASTGILSKAVKLMEKYSDTPMDFADASLVLLAEQLQIYAVCTLDRRGFSTFRVGRKPFRLVLDK